MGLSTKVADHPTKLVRKFFLDRYLVSLVLLMNAEKSQQKDYQRNSLTAQTELSTNKKIVSIFMILSDTFRSGFFQLKLRLKKKNDI